MSLPPPTSETRARRTKILSYDIRAAISRNLESKSHRRPLNPPTVGIADDNRARTRAAQRAAPRGATSIEARERPLSSASRVPNLTSPTGIALAPVRVPDAEARDLLEALQLRQGRGRQAERTRGAEAAARPAPPQPGAHQLLSRTRRGLRARARRAHRSPRRRRHPARRAAPGGMGAQETHRRGGRAPEGALRRARVPLRGARASDGGSGGVR